MANGRVEKALGETKRRLRRLLHSADLGPELWLMALRYAMETDRIRRRGELKNIPGFGDPGQEANLAHQGVGTDP